MLDLETLQRRVSKGEAFDYVYFWGHQPSKDGSFTKACFSQWFVAPFIVGGVVYPTAEHWMMARKAELFGDEATLAEILTSPSPKEAKALGRKVANFNDAIWDQNRCRIVIEGNMAKFSQHADMKQLLLSTGDAVLVEASPRDRVWGIGMGANNENAGTPAKWRGQNLLGFTLMAVRDELRSRQ